MIRPATPADAAAMAAIWNHYIRETTVTFLPDEKTTQDVAEVIALGNCLVWDDGVLRGFARYFQFRGGRGYAYTAEHTLLLAPDAGGRGIGRALLDAICAEAAAAGMHSMWAVVSGENEAAVNFHLACGFDSPVRLAEVGYKFGRWLDAIMLQKRL